MTIATQAFVDEAGSEAAVKFMSPYGKHHGLAAALIFKERLGTEGTDAIAISSTMYFGNVCAGVVIEKFEASPEIGVGYIRSCTIENAPRELCTSVCRIASRGFSEAFNLDFDTDVPYALAKGDPYCLWVIRRKDRTYSPKDLKKETLVTIPPPIIEKEERDLFTMAALGERWTIVTKAFLECSGTTASKKLERYFHQSGLAFGLKYSGMWGENINDTERISKTLDLCNMCLGRKVIPVWSSKGEMETIISECPFSSSPKEMRMQFEAFANGICEAINPGFEVVHPKAMCNGDPMCRRVIRKKGKVDV